MHTFKVLIGEWVELVSYWTNDINFALITFPKTHKTSFAYFEIRWRCMLNVRNYLFIDSLQTRYERYLSLRRSVLPLTLRSTGTPRQASTQGRTRCSCDTLYTTQTSLTTNIICVCIVTLITYNLIKLSRL